MSKRPELLITNGELSGKRFTVAEGGVRLGRSSSNDIHTADEGLSRNHCLFEPVGEDGVRLTDLQSANGTYVNDKQLGTEPVTLHVGDAVEVGSLIITVVGDTPPAAGGAVDLGFGGGASGVAGGGAAGGRKRSPLMNILWVLLIPLAIAAIWFVAFSGSDKDAKRPAAALPLAKAEPQLREVYYEKVEANTDKIFRYAMTLAPDGTVTVSIDDVPGEDRHLTKSVQLSKESLAELGQILSYKTLQELDPEYAGATPDVPSLASWTLRVVYTTRAHSVSIVNAQEPEVFRSIREKLEAFTKNELGIWAIQYSRDKLIELAKDSIALGRSKWEEIDVEHGNLYESFLAYRAAIFYLETVDPKPDCIGEAREGLDRAEKELERRYKEQRFRADRAINLGQFEEAKAELTTLLEMIPDRRDDRNRDASAKLVDIERRMKKGGK